MKKEIYTQETEKYPNKMVQISKIEIFDENDRLKMKLTLDKTVHEDLTMEDSDHPKSKETMTITRIYPDGKRDNGEVYVEEKVVTYNNQGEKTIQKHTKESVSGGSVG